jgi:hypothetical protein
MTVHAREQEAFDRTVGRGHCRRKSNHWGSRVADFLDRRGIAVGD